MDILPTILQWSLMFRKSDTFPARTEQYQAPAGFEMQDRKEDVSVQQQQEQEQEAENMAPVQLEVKKASKVCSLIYLQ